MRDVRWAGSTLADLGALASPVRQALGADILQLQMGQSPMHWRPRTRIGRGVREIWAVVGGAWWILYTTETQEEVWVLHVFQRRTPHIEVGDVKLASMRCEALLQEQRSPRRRTPRPPRS